MVDKVQDSTVVCVSFVIVFVLLDQSLPKLFSEKCINLMIVHIK